MKRAMVMVARAMATATKRTMWQATKRALVMEIAIAKINGGSGRQREQWQGKLG
jgi:hypothetical protein